MKYNRKNRTIVSGIMVGLASIFAVASYFDVDWGELNGFLLATLVFFSAIVLLALVTLVLFKLGARLLRMPGKSRQDAPQNESDKE